jgi:hypothetical protein
MKFTDRMIVNKVASRINTYRVPMVLLDNLHYKRWTPEMNEELQNRFEDRFHILSFSIQNSKEEAFYPFLAVANNPAELWDTFKKALIATIPEIHMATDPKLPFEGSMSHKMALQAGADHKKLIEETFGVILDDFTMTQADFDKVMKG